MFCSKCGTQIFQQAQFCSGCGISIGASQSAPQSPGPYVYVPNQPNYTGVNRAVSPISFGDAISSFFRNYANFNGRARRSEYWFATLLVSGVSMFLFILDEVNSSYYQEFTFFTMLYVFWVLGTFLPSLAISVRRLHDVGRFGTYIWMALIPLAGAIILLIEFVKDSQPGANQFGPSKK